MPYNYKFRILVDSDNCLSTFQFATEKEVMNKYRELNNDGVIAQIYPIVYNTDPRRADYTYRWFDVVVLDNQIGIVLCMPNQEPEFHGFRNDLESCFDYIDEYYYNKERNKYEE